MEVKYYSCKIRKETSTGNLAQKQNGISSISFYKFDLSMSF